MAQLFVFIPSFRGNISALTFETSHYLMSTLFGKGIKAAVATYSWPDIAELRNMVLSVWYDTMKESTHILFVDDDMGFPPELVTEMVEFDEPVVGVIYPKKITPRVWCGSGIEAAEYRKGFIEVEAVGAGILLIRRDAVAKMIEAYPDLINDYMATEDMKAAGGTRTMRFFDQLITDAGKAGEDISFCRRWGQIGGTVWASTSYTIQHVGPWTFSGCFAKERQAEADAIAFARMKRDEELYASHPIFLTTAKAKRRILGKSMKAYEQENNPPFRGDIRPTVDVPAGTPLNEITQFEVFDGAAWVAPDPDMRMMVQDGKATA